MSWNTSSVDKFLNLVQTAKAYNSKEVRMTASEAQDLAFSIMFMLNQERAHVQKVLQLQEQLIRAQNERPSMNNQLNGGSF